MRKLFSWLMAAFTYICLLALVITGITRASIEAKERKPHSLARSHDDPGSGT